METDGYGDGSGNGFGDGFGDGSGDGNGYGGGYGNGYGSGELSAECDNCGEIKTDVITSMSSFGETSQCGDCRRVER